MNVLGNLHIVPALAPIDTASTVTEAYSDVVDAGECSEIEFDFYAGVITGDTIVIKAYSDANTTGGGGTAIPFRYKLSSATGTDTSADWVYSASTGYTMSAGADGMLLRVNINPADCTNALPYCYLGIDPGSSMTVLLQAMWAITVPRYNQGIPPSTVD